MNINIFYKIIKLYLKIIECIYSFKNLKYIIFNHPLYAK